AVTTNFPSGLNDAEFTASACSIATETGSPVVASQIRALLSSEAVSTKFPSGLNKTDVSGALCFMGADIAFPVKALQTRAVLPDIVTSRLLSGLNSTDLTASCCIISDTACPVRAFHTWVERSSAAVTTYSLFGLNAVISICWVGCLGMGCPMDRCVATSQTLARLSKDDVSKRRPSRLKAT